MADRLISADLLLDWLRNIDAENMRRHLEGRKSKWLNTDGVRHMIVTLLEKAPVDAVEVVRCKDCKHWSDGVSGCTDRVKCCKIGFYMVGGNGYCVYGERRTNGGGDG